MKKEGITKTLIKIIAVLLIILVCLISFFGIYKRNLNNWKQFLPDFNLSKELTGSTNFSFIVDDSTEEKELDEEEPAENVEEATAEETVEATDETSEDEPTTTEVPVNAPETLNVDNYKKAKDIIEKRIKNFGIVDVNVSVDEQNGTIIAEVPDGTKATNVAALGSSTGKIEIIDTETEEVLIDRKMIKKISAYYVASDTATAENPTYDLGISLEFTSEGEKKLNEISKIYIETVDSSGDTTQKTVTVRIDGEDKRTTYFSPDGTYTTLNVTLYQAVDIKDEQIFNDRYNECAIYQAVLNEDELPIKYVTGTSSYLESNLHDDFIWYVIIGGIVLFAIITLIVIKKYGKKGLLAAIVEAGYVAVLLLLIRAASVSLAISGIVMIVLMSLVNYLFINMLVNGEKTKQLKTFLVNMIPFFITIIVFVFSKNINITSVGMVGFWGLITCIYTFLFSLLLLDERNDD